MKNIFLILFFCSIFSIAFGQKQKQYFVDGYHGGIYGHYPIEWKTKFIVDGVNKYPDWRICLEIEPETWDTVKLKTPEAYKQLQKIVTNKRVEFTNPTYAQPYCYNISGESIIRQFEYGIKHINKHFPEVKFATYSVEEPCFTSSLPQILKSFGFKYAVLKCPNTCWGGYTRPYGGELVNWIGPDGTSILTVPRYACEQLEKNSTWQTTAWQNSDKYIDTCIKYGIKHPIGMCFQDAGWIGGPWLGYGNKNKSNSVYVTWKEYFENITDGKTNDNYYMPQEDVLVELMWGSQVMQRIGRQVRESENKVITAEKMGVIANINNGHPYDRNKLDEAWRTLMLAQHHDSWIVPYNILNNDKTWADEIERWTESTNKLCTEVINAAKNSFKVSETEKNGCIRVYNTLGVPRNETISILLPVDYIETNLAVLDEKGNMVNSTTEKQGNRVKITIQANVPAFGYTTHSVKTVTSKKENLVPYMKDYTFENDMYKIVFDNTKGGTIKSLIAKHEGNKEFVDSNNKYKLGEIRGHFYDDNRFYSSVENQAKISLVKNNGMEAVILIEGEIASHPFIQKITLIEGQKRIDFDLVINWTKNVGIGEYKQEPKEMRDNRRAFSDDRFKLNILFPVNLNSPKLYKDAPFDVCESKLESTAYKSWNSIKHNIILNWVSLSETGGHGFTVFSDHTTSYSYAKNDFPLGLTLQYSGMGLWGRDYNITMPTNVNYSIIPHSGNWDKSSIVEENSRWNEPLIAEYKSQLPVESKSFLDLSGTGYQISASYVTNNGILFRLYNADGNDTPQDIKFGFKLTSITEVNLSGEVIKQYTGNNINVTIPRFGFKTFLITYNSDLHV